MTYFRLDEGQPVDAFYIVRSIIMTGVVGISIWDLWARHAAPQLFGMSFDVPDILQQSFFFNQRLVAEFVYVSLCTALLPLCYIYVWRPLVRRALYVESWLIHGLTYGFALHVTFFCLIAAFDGLRIDLLTNVSFLIGWLIGHVATSLGIAGFVRLRELNRMEI